MKIAIRVDSSLQIGTGHVMRCLTLADALKAKGAKVVFVCREHPGHLCDKIAGKGFEVFRLESGSDNDSLQADSFALTHASWLGTSQSVDVTKTIAALHDNAPWDWIIVDHYALDHCWESAMCKVANNIMVIDDLADRKHECDLLLDQNYFQEPEKRYESLLLEHCKTLLGPKYALLRPEFREARKFCRMRGNGIARILVYFGGNNPDNLTGMALEALSTPELEHLLVEAVIGPNNQHQEQLEKQAKNRPGTRLHVQPENFTELMLRADFCIGAGGTTTWERLCLGLPSLVITVAQNQEPFTRELDEAGYVRWLGNKEQVNVSDIRVSLISEIYRSKNQENRYGLRSLVDGYGALWIAEKLVPCNTQDLSLRKASENDIELFFSWANEPTVRKNSFQQEPITWQEHVSWFKNKLASSNSIIWVLQTSKGLPVGQIRFDINDGVADIDYTLGPLVRGRGWGRKLLKMGLLEFKRIHQNVRCQGKVKADNLPSRRCFQQLGFIEESNGGQCFSLAVISDQDSWINQYIPDLLQEWLHQGHSVLWVHHPGELTPGDFCFLLGCGQLISRATLDMFRHNLVVHESDLPRGKGWSPLTWQIFESRNRIPVTLLEAAEKVDSGTIYDQEWIEFQGHELVDELRQKQAQATIRLCRKFVNEYPDIVAVAREQEGEESFYSRRGPKDSALDPDKSINDQFNLLRVVDNERYPAWFELNGQKYVLKIKKQ